MVFSKTSPIGQPAVVSSVEGVYKHMAYKHIATLVNALHRLQSQPLVFHDSGKVASPPAFSA